jgi:hypothetical protein
MSGIETDKTAPNKGTSPRGHRRPAPEGRTLSGQLRDLIRNRGESVYSLSQAAGVDHRVVGRFLEGKTITLATADRLGAVLNLRIGEGFSTPGRAKGKPKKTSRKSQHC